MIEEVNKRIDKLLVSYPSFNLAYVNDLESKDNLFDEFEFEFPEANDSTLFTSDPDLKEYLLKKGATLDAWICEL